MIKVYWLRFLLINPSKIKDWKYILFLFLIFILFIGLSIKVGKSIGPLGDANVFWNAGRNFFLGNELYSGVGGAQRFIYPPFAAMMLQALAIFPMQVAREGHCALQL